MDQIVICLLMVKKFINSNQKILRLTTPLCLGNISEDWTVDNIKKLDLLAMFMILVLIMMLLQLMIY